MGIEQFFSSIEENNITNLETSFTKKLKKQLDTKYLHIDFNSIIHVTSYKVVSDLNYILYNLITNNNKNSKTNKFNNLINTYNLNKNITAEELTKNINLDNLILDKVLEYTLNIINNYVNPKLLTNLFIAIDGVPTKSKMLEQKKRRYMGTVINQMKKRIFEKYEDNLKQDTARYKYEKLKISWGKNLISPGTLFMNQVDTMLKSDKFITLLKKACINLKNYTYSGVYMYGEGEKKIIDHIKNNINNQTSQLSFVIYSPDSDMTLLGLLLNIKNLKLIRHNQQKDNYDIVDIDILKNNLYKYVLKKVPNKDLNKNMVIDDIVLILTIFGNDFLPKLESFSVRQDFNRIIDKYIEVIKNNSKYLIVNMVGEKIKTIDQNILLEIIKILHIDEGGNLQKKFMDQHYLNYNKLKKLLGADQTNFTNVMNEFLADLRTLNKNIKNNDNIDITQNNDFFNKLRKLVDFRSSNIQDFITKYKDYYDKNNKFPKVSVGFINYDRSLDDEYHIKNLEKSLNYLDNITDYDKEIYKFENMLDKYKAYPINLGHVQIDTNTYTWKAENIQKGVKRYYSEVFGIKNIKDAKNVTNKSLKILLQNYIDGLMWVFQYYFNDYDIKQYADVWYYPYSHAPLLTQLYYLLREETKDINYINNIDKKLLNYKISNTNTDTGYFNCVEHLMYTSPANLMLNIIPSEYHEFTKNKTYYPDIDKIISLIDCKGALFLTKCHVEFKLMTWSEDKKFLDSLRKIKLSDKTKILTKINNEDFISS